MLHSPAEIITVKHLKKDGSLDDAIVASLVKCFKSGGTVLLPVDGVYVVAGINEPHVCSKLEMFSENSDGSIFLLNSFALLDQLACYSKSDYDFLRRVWPGEINVLLDSRCASGASVVVRMPKTRFVTSVLHEVNKPVTVFNLYKNRSSFSLYHKKNELIEQYGSKVDMILVVEEWCRNIPLSTTIDIRGGLSIIRQGRTSYDEIQSLYFLA